MFGFSQDMILGIPGLLIALTIHEYAHARVAVWLGDSTPKYLGRLTLNPIAHLDPFGLIMLWLFRLGWAKPVPVNPNNFKDSRNGMMLVSLAGPLANIIIAVITALLIVLLFKINLLTGVWERILGLTHWYNIGFAIFNLIPLPPLDGSKIVINLLPGRQAYEYEKLEPYGPVILAFLIYLNVISKIIGPIEEWLHSMINLFVMMIF